MLKIFSCDIYDKKYTNRILKEYISFLSQEELQRYVRFQNANRQKQFLIAHGELRECLSRVLKKHPGEIVMVYTSNGKMVEKNNSMYFSISHTGATVFVAISDREIGIDSEMIVDRPFDKLSRYIFPYETAEIILSADSRYSKRHLFYRKWTEKEALCKLLDRKLFDKDMSHNFSLYQNVINNIQVSVIAK